MVGTAAAVAIGVPVEEKKHDMLKHSQKRDSDREHYVSGRAAAHIC